MGEQNSSITRVWPVFGKLLRQDSYGKSWLATILGVCPQRYDWLNELVKNPGTLSPEENNRKPIQIKPDGDATLRDLAQEGIQTFELPACFERKLAPPMAFLVWLIKNPHRMTIPENEAAWGKKETTIRDRKILFGIGEYEKNDKLQHKLQQAALNELGRRGSRNSDKQWWAFEGFTSVDCYLETDRLVLLIEGKRTERFPSPSTSWFRTRDQIVRNLEAARESALAKDKQYAVLLVEDPDDPKFSRSFKLTKEIVSRSLPHFANKPELQREIAGHFLGPISWKQICEATGLRYEALPLNVGKAVEALGLGASKPCAIL